MENFCFLQKKRTNSYVQDEIKVFVFTKKWFIGKIASYLNWHTIEGSPSFTGLSSSVRVENQQYFKVVVSISTTDFVWTL